MLWVGQSRDHVPFSGVGHGGELEASAHGAPTGG